jgi:class 3 adenylate cyclase
VLVVLLVVLAPVVGGALGSLSVSTGLGYLAVVPYAVVGGFLAILRPRNTISWLLIALAWGFGLAFINVPATTEQLVTGTATTWATTIALVQAWVGGAILALLLAITLLFPTGRLPSGRWGAIARLLLVFAAAMVVLTAFAPTVSVYPNGSSVSIDAPNPLAVAPGLAIWPAIGAVWPLLLAMSLVGLASMFVRLRRAGGVERAQLRWLTWSLALVCVGLLIGIAGSAVLPDSLGGLVWVPAEIGFVLPPIAIAISVMRYRLYEIDLLINRTAVYGLVTLVLVAVVAVTNLALQRMFETATGQHSDAIAVALGAAAALAFAPLRRRVRPLVDRVLPARAVLTLLFTDIVGSTQTVVQLGDARWRGLLGQYRATVRAELSRHRGHEIDTAGDSFFVTFERPKNGLECAFAMRSAVRALGLETRTGLHLGEVELRGEQPSGLAVHTAARVMAVAGDGEILLSDDLRGALPDSDLLLTDRGLRELRGVPGQWHLYAADALGGVEERARPGTEPVVIQAVAVDPSGLPLP